MRNAINLVLSALGDVREVGDHWQATCPAHDDKKPSLAIRDGDRAVMLRCWSGCTFAAIVEAMGLKVSDLFHEPLSDGEKNRRAGIATRKVLGHHALVVLIAANQGPPFSGQDLGELREAERILKPSPDARFAVWCARVLLAARKLPERHQMRLCQDVAALLGGNKENGATGLRSAVQETLGGYHAA